MELRQETVHIYKHGYSEIAKLFKESFPEGEQFPLWTLRLLTVLKPAKFSAFYDGDTLAGILYSIESTDYFFILYLAVNPKIRSCGYGGKILEYTFDRAGDRPIVLNVEALDENADNNEQRKRRNAFYARHGIIEVQTYNTDLKKRLSFRLTVPYSEERRRAAEDVTLRFHFETGCLYCPCRFVCFPY